MKFRVKVEQVFPLDKGFGLVGVIISWDDRLRGLSLLLLNYQLNVGWAK